MQLVPITLRTANEFVNLHHRHNKATQGHKFSIGLDDGGELVGVVIVGRPVSRALDDGYTAEITRCCVLCDVKNANSMLYGAAVRAAKAIGYRRVITYTLPEESGSSLRGSGFRQIGITTHNSSWDTPSRPRTNQDYPMCKKIRWMHD